MYSCLKFKCGKLRTNKLFWSFVETLVETIEDLLLVTALKSINKKKESEMGIFFSRYIKHETQDNCFPMLLDIMFDIYKKMKKEMKFRTDVPVYFLIMLYDIIICIMSII